MEKQMETTLISKTTFLQGVMGRLNKLFDFITDLNAALAAILLILMTLMICYSVVMRYYFNMPAGWSNEVTEYILLYITFLGATWLLKRDGHVRVDLLLNNMGKTARSLLNIWTTLLAIGICALIIYHGTLSTIDHFHRGIPVIKSLSIAKYLLIWIIPAGMFLLLIQFIRDLFFHTGQFFISIRKKEDRKDKT